MKRILFYTLLGITALVAGCSDDLVESKVVRHQGEDIVFGARAGFENANPNIRTIYTDEYYEEGGKKYEGVNWVTSEDIIRIYCAQAVNPAEGGAKYADYKVTNDPSTDHQLKSYATLERYNPAGALQWGANDVTHEFYAVYPSPLQNDKVSIDGSVVKGSMPTNQTPISIEKSSGIYEAKPDMRFAYLTAHTSVGPNEGGNGISLSFQSIATVLELELAYPQTSVSETLSLSDLTLVGPSDARLSGSFEANLDNIGSDRYPTCTLVDEGAAQNYVNLSLLIGADKKPVTLNRGEKLKVTFFTLPVGDLSNLSLRIQTSTGSKTMSLAQSGSGEVAIKAHMKHLLNNITLPAAKIESHNWISQVDDDVYLSQLSIPATGNTYTYKYSGTNAQYWQTQTKTIDEQWAMGIRCFEIMTTSVDEAGKSSFGNVPIILNNEKGSSLGVTVGEAVNAINAKIKANPKEFAMIVVKYQPTVERKTQNFLNGFISYFDGLTNVKKVLFKPNLTVKEARGSIMFVVRPTSEGEDYGEDANISAANGKDFLVVKGWGSLQDKWSKRGYPVPAYVDPRKGSEKTMEHYMLAENTSKSSAPTFETLPVKGTPDYTYESNQSFDVWAQEWPRVVENDTKVYTGLGLTRSVWFTAYHLWAHWGESYNEKLKDAEDTFDEAVANKDNTSMVYFNSISGYFIVPSVQATIIPCFVEWNGYKNWGNIYGDVDSYSTKINKDFYQYVVAKASTAGGAPGITGPMGVVMISHVGADEPSTLMPNVIISNNFKFPLKKDEGNRSTTSYRRAGSSVK